MGAACGNVGNDDNTTKKNVKQTEQPKSNLNNLTADDKAIFNCKQCRDRLKNYIKKLENSEKLHKEKAKEFLKNKLRDRAKLSLSRSKVFAAQINSANNNLNVINEQIMLIEQTRNQKDVMDVLEKGNNVLKELQKDVNIERWENIKEDMEDIKAEQDEIGNLLKGYGITQSDHEESVNKDLEELMKQQAIEIDAQLPTAKKVDLKAQLPEPGNKDVQRVEPVETEQKHEPELMVEEV